MSAGPEETSPISHENEESKRGGPSNSQLMENTEQVKVGLRGIIGN